MFEDTQEQWKDIKGYEGLYAVSTKGRVKSLKTGRILSESYKNDGYRVVALNSRNYSVHRLVALAFLPNPHNLTEVNHKNEIKHDNDVKNLEWCSRSYNVNYSSHKRSCKIKQFDKNGNLIKAWDSFKQIEDKLGYFSCSIRNACRGKQRYAYGYRWEYLDSSSQRVVNRPVAVYKGEDYIGTFASATKASEALGLKYCSVNCCLHGRLATLKGYTFKYAE